MASSVLLPLLSFVLLHAIILSSNLVHCDDEDLLYQGINSYRQSLHLPALTEHENAGCLADKVAEQLEDVPCSPHPQIADYAGVVQMCHVDLNSTKDGVVLPVCVPNLVPNLVLNNFTKTQYSTYLRDTKFTGIGLGTEDNWMVVILTTNTSAGSFISH